MEDVIGDARAASLLKAVSCTICLEANSEIAILQCHNGHLICSVCAYQIRERKCPTCKDDLACCQSIRNRAAEDVLSLLPRRCSHCESMFRDDTERKNHARVCVRRPVDCPFIERGCPTRRVPFEEIKTHLRSRHGDAIVESVSYEATFVQKTEVGSSLLRVLEADGHMYTMYTCTSRRSPRLVTCSIFPIDLPAGTITPVVLQVRGKRATAKERLLLLPALITRTPQLQLLAA